MPTARSGSHPGRLTSSIARYHVGVKPETRTFIAAFLQGFTGAGLFQKLEIPGMPTRMFLPEPGEEDVYREEWDEVRRKANERRDSVSFH